MGFERLRIHFSGRGISGLCLEFIGHWCVINYKYAKLSLSLMCLFFSLLSTLLGKKKKKQQRLKSQLDPKPKLKLG
jgi:hypothetical protein